MSAFSPSEAIFAWLDGDYTIYDVPVLVSAIRKDPRITLSDAAIVEFMDEAMMKGWKVSTCVRRLAAAR